MQSKQRGIITLVSLVAGMFLLAFAAFPLYTIFCKATGFGGATQVALEGSSYKGKRNITVYFDANVDAGLPWQFRPQQRAFTVRTGENAVAFYTSENSSDTPITGMAVYNVTPERAGIYFQKIHCFCFEEQTLLPHQRVVMPVSFYIDPALEDDPAMDKVDTITLSYTFFKVKEKAS